MTATPSRLFIVCLLGALSVISPFAIDMYLPVFPQLAHDFSVPGTMISLTLSSYFIGMALGQVFYGPLLDRYGRKKPLFAGLGLFIISSAGCAMAPTIESLVVLRFIQGLGGCAAAVASLAMVRDFFPVNESAKILSLMFLFIAVSPLCAPSIGGMVMIYIGWRFVFFIMAAIVAAVVALIWFLLPESHAPDPSIELKFGPIVAEYVAILKHPKFATYAFAGAFSFAGLFTYVAGSPIIFMENFHMSAQAYSGVFAIIAVGFIGCSQFNGLLLRRMNSETLFIRVLTIQAIIGVVFLVGTYNGWYGLVATMVLFFIFLACAGITYPNAAAIALAPFSKNAGSASALLGFLQLGVGAVISTGISMSHSHESFPIIAILGVTVSIAYAILLLGRKRTHDCMVMA